MTSRLVIAGAGDFGRELYGWLKTSPKYLESRGISDIAFIDDNTNVNLPPSARSLGTIKEYAPRSEDVLLCSVGNPRNRRTVINHLSQSGARFSTFIHDSVLVGGEVQVGTGSIICPGGILSTNILIGEHVHINTSCSIGHDVRIGSYATLSSNCNLTGHVVVGDEVFFGTSVTVIPGKSVGDRSKVGAGSIVLRKLPADVSAFGNPCRQLGKIKS